MWQACRHTLESFAARFHDVVPTVPVNMDVNEAGGNKEARRIENFNSRRLLCESVFDPASLNFDPECSTQFIGCKETVGLDDIVRRCRHIHGLLLSTTTENKRTLTPVRTPGDVARQPGCPCRLIDNRNRRHVVSSELSQESGGPKAQRRGPYSRPEMYRYSQHAYH